MSDFCSIPPSKKSKAVSGFFQGGMMPASPYDFGSLIVFDLRSLKLSIEETQKLENILRDALEEGLKTLGREVADRSALDLSGTVFGISID